MDLTDLRQEYTVSGLRRADLVPSPIRQLEKWLNEAVQARLTEPTAMCLSTVDKDTQPSTRIVLLKGLDDRGLLFFTNYESRKGCDLSNNPRASVNLFWKELERQVSVDGSVTRCDRTESEQYFKSRPRGSQIGAWVSKQSRPVRDRATLEAEFHELEGRYEGREIPLPPFWGGFVLNPVRMEFWQGRPSRMHDRFAYSKSGEGGWELKRLSP